MKGVSVAHVLGLHGQGYVPEVAQLERQPDHAQVLHHVQRALAQLPLLFWQARRALPVHLHGGTTTTPRAPAAVPSNLTAHTAQVGVTAAPSTAHT